MNTKYILIILGEPYSTFVEILGKYFKSNKTLKKKIILIGSKNLLENQLNDLNYFLRLNQYSSSYAIFLVYFLYSK